MATPKQQKNGTWVVTVTHNYQRRTITLGKVEKRDAVLFAGHCELLADCIKHGTRQPVQLLSWISALTKRHRIQLAEIGLLSNFNPLMTVEELVDEFLKDYEIRFRRKEIRASTLTQFHSAMLRFSKSFIQRKVSELEPKRQHDRINSAAVFSTEAKIICTQLESWQREHYALASWSRANGRMREIGNWAVQQGICDYNPFSLLQTPKQTNLERNVEVSREWVLDAMEQCQHPDIRLLFVLGRFCGLRMLSEARTIRPQDIDFECRTLKILDSKKLTYRTMPLFALVERELLRHKAEICWDRYVLGPTVLQNSNQSSTGLMKLAVKRTGQAIWMKFNQNMRSSCENDLLRQGFDERQVTLWLGHTITVSREHYQKQFAQDYVEAVSRSTY